MSVDWSEAPEGAVYYYDGVSNKDHIEHWVNAEGKIIVVGYDDDWNEAMESYPRSNLEYHKKPDTEWMPEVGQECEFDCTASGREISSGGVIKYLSKYTCVVERWCSGGEFVAHPDTINFRPIKTEREDLIHVLCGGHNELETSILDNVGWGEIADRILDAGYRKQP